MICYSRCGGEEGGWVLDGAVSGRVDGGEWRVHCEMYHFYRWKEQFNGRYTYT